ncbi:uncharacterized protein BXZ73DRAFT_48326 [Epithele typhae]|uniref:uncharacterized protein n=1 Tax=Epithele typhae TaxID=378194 RepID=UPI0020073AF1|nr:uncharacterized protein BXZ73DRAFT_48326 [Epithele typhae]KAH9928524.1 hypothetical protein BXZ73DRAFT_48326 [Epithele typhae]
MEHLPAELLVAIALVACRDGGFTGSSLSLVSRRIRDATHPARFHSVSLAWCPDRLHKFLETYGRQLSRFPNACPRVKHLFLSLFPAEGNSQVSPMPPLPDYRMFYTYDKYLASLERQSATHWPSVCEFIRTVAPDLETFAFVRGEWTDIAVTRCAFPRLRELTLVDSCPGFLHVENTPLDHGPLFPALERLHSVEFFYAPPVDFQRWALHAPALTHLRCSGIHHHNSPTAISLQATVDNAVDDAVFFPHLQHVLAQPMSSKCHPAYPWNGQRILREHLQFCSQNARPGVQFDVVDWKQNPGSSPLETAPMKCVRRAKELWLERIEGGEGCWSESYAF